MAPIPQPVDHAAAAAWRGSLYVLAGRAAGQGNFAAGSPPRRRRWSALPDLPTPRHGTAAVAFGGRVHVLAGGLRPGLTFSDAAEALRVR